MKNPVHPFRPIPLFYGTLFKKSLFKQRRGAPAEPSLFHQAPDTAEVRMARDALSGMPFWKMCDLVQEVIASREDVNPIRLEKLSNALGTQAFTSTSNMAAPEDS